MCYAPALAVSVLAALGGLPPLHRLPSSDPSTPQKLRLLPRLQISQPDPKTRSAPTSLPSPSRERAAKMTRVYIGEGPHTRAAALGQPFPWFVASHGPSSIRPPGPSPGAPHQLGASYHHPHPSCCTTCTTYHPPHTHAGNLATGILERELEDEFVRFGRIRSIWVARKPAGFGTSPAAAAARCCRPPPLPHAAPP